MQNAPPGFVTFYPNGQSLPATSNLNYVPGQAVPNAFIIGLHNGSLDAYATTATDLIIDVTGYFDTNNTGATYTALLNPVRLLDTRAGNTACVTTGTPLSAGASFNLVQQPTCTGVTSGAKAVLGNGTVVNGPNGGPGFVTFYPGQTVPANATDVQPELRGRTGRSQRVPRRCRQRRKLQCVRDHHHRSRHRCDRLLRIASMH